MHVTPNETVNVKPVFLNLVHSSAYEGPCRTGKRENLTPEADRQRGREAFERFLPELRENVGAHVVLQTPCFLERRDDFVVPESELRKLEPEIYDADLVLVAGSGLRQVPSLAIAARYGTPIGQIGWVGTVDTVAALRSRGLEGYAFLDYADFNHFTELLRVRKAFRRTRMMIVTQDNSFPSGGVVSSITDLAGLQQRLGVNATFVSASRVTNAMDTLPPEAEQEVEDLTNQLIRDATACHMAREDVVPSVQFFIAVKRLLEQYECNAFTIPCFEICATKVMEERRVMFCLAHTLLKDMGIPSACEADTNVLMAISLLMNLSGKSVMMGNSWAEDRERNVLRVCHDVPGLKMNGFDQPPLPYELRNFTEAGWGATVRHDFTAETGQRVTLARFNPDGDAVLVAGGTIVGSAGVDTIGCSFAVDIEINDVADVFEKEQDFGHHLAVVLGDYVDDVVRLGKITGLRIVTS